MPLSFALTEQEKSKLGDVAITVLNERFQHLNPQEPNPENYTLTLRRKLGAFVTLTKEGALRGCIGNIVGYMPLIKTVWRMSQAAAFEDPRFPPISATEWPGLSMEITVLDELSPCFDTSCIEIGKHGLVLVHRGHTGVFLPQVPVEQHWTREAYLTNLCYKAGLPDGSWKEKGAKLFCYEGLVFPVLRSKGRV